ncbi:C39 family peptidase [Pseudanabaena sp. FACHB-1998]|uniref:C39 family peptidase n=1 Tax=Pseudanabaena sp. FACHB-1998 TaxID=2692858 RepID=UPI001680E6A3|nr:C39 family peptidase [Pseudanabaena sp. FACHB-1998]MBD2177359.1 C39 family peptidase [Pseudanabaena sp. FACHB-1998]
MTAASSNSPVNSSAPSAAPQILTITQAPSEVVVNREIAIAGTADFSQVLQILVTLPNDIPVPVVTNPTARTWQAKLASGLSEASAIFLRVRAIGVNNQLLTEQIVNILVRQPPITLITKQATRFKSAPADSATLPPAGKVDVRAGQSFEVVRYGAIAGHIKVLLKQPIAPVGEFGYFYALHVDLVAPVTLTVKQNTIFKVSTASSLSLALTQKVEVKAGTKFLLDGDYAITENHVRVKLAQPLAPIGQEGFFFLPHVELVKLGETLDSSKTTVGNIPIKGAILTVKTDTFLKASSQNASSLTDNQKLMIKAGTSYAIAGYAAVNGHFRVKLATAIAPIGDVGFFYERHVSITKNGKAIAFDPDMKTMTIKQNTVLKKRPIDSRQLAPSDLAPLTAGDIYGIDSFSLSDIHFQVTLNEDVPPLGNSGYIFAGHVTLQQGGKPLEIAPRQKVLGVPYFSQLDNPRDPYVTCNVTSIAMVLAFHGKRSRNPQQQLEDELYQWIINKYGAQSRTDNQALQALYRAYGFGGEFSTSRTWSQIRQEIIANRPVVIGGYFTHGGHIICIIGFDEQGFIVHDPYGNALTGYSQTEGKSLRYPYIYMRDMCGVDGDVWAHFILPR